MSRLKLYLLILVYYFTSNTTFGQPADTTKVIFIGSSIIAYYHSVPDILDSLAIAGDTSIITYDASLTGFTFEKHVRNPATMASISTGEWDYAYLACWGGVTNDTEDEYTYPWMTMLCDSLRKYNADIKIILSMTHIRDSDVFYAGASGYDDPYWDDWYRSVLNKNTDGYKAIAEDHSTILDPFALVWDEVFVKKMPGINLYGQDNAHLNAYGAYLMASDVYTIIFGSSPKYLHYTHNLDSDTCFVLREASDKIILGSPDEWGVVTGIEEFTGVLPPVLLYPNPASDYIKLDIDPGEEIRIEIISYSTASPVLVRNIHGGKEKILNIESLPSGMYIVRIVNGTRLSHSKLVINR